MIYVLRIPCIRTAILTKIPVRRLRYTVYSARLISSYQVSIRYYYRIEIEILIYRKEF